MIVDGLRMKSEYFHMMSLTLSENGELEEAQEEIKSNMKVEDVALESSPLIDSPQTTASTCKPMDSVVLQVFLMIFFAEWGGRSQVSTILLAGTHPVMSVFLGGCVGYFLTSILAVLGGSFLATVVSPRIVTIFGRRGCWKRWLGGFLFLLFAGQTFFMKSPVCTNKAKRFLIQLPSSPRRESPRASQRTRTPARCGMSSHQLNSACAACTPRWSWGPDPESRAACLCRYSSRPQTTQLWRRTCSRCSTQKSCPPSCGEPSSHPPRSDPQRPRQLQRRPTHQQRVHLSYQILPQLSENTRGSLHLQNPAAAVGEGLLFRNIPSRLLPRREQADL